MKMLDDYFELQQKIFDYFGYVEDWRVIPLDNAVGYKWFLLQNKDGSGEVVFGESEDKLDYSSQIYTQRHLPKWVYRTEDYTMVCADPQTDMNKFLMVFDNKNEITDNKIIKKWSEK